MSRRRQMNADEAEGGWKGAFADFCMSMMTLFMVLWTVSITDQDQRESLSMYFTDPGIFESVSSRHVIEKITEGMVIDLHPGRKSVADRPELTEIDVRGGDPFEIQVTEMGRFQDHLNIKRIPGGLLIELVETEDNPMFLRGEYQLTPFFEDLLLVLGPKLMMSEHDLAIIGHTDSTPYVGGGYFDNWSLSFARANSVREIMEFVGMPQSHISQVTGMADSRPLNPDSPTDAINRRVELILFDPLNAEDINDPVPEGGALTAMGSARSAAGQNQI